MLSRSGVLLIALVSIAGAQDQRPKLTARELFYSAVQPVKPGPAQARAKAPAKQAPATEVASASKNSAPPAPAITQSAGLPDGGKVMPAVMSASASAGLPLGLKYAILKAAGGQPTEVPVDTVFHAGDRIQLSVETNGPGYLYIISRGSSGTWKPLFPSPEVEDGNNRVAGFHAYVLPPKSRLIFDEQTGSEKVFVVFSREPEPNLEKLIYSLQGVTPSSAPKPAAPKPAAPNGSEPVQPKTLYALADTRIDDRTVGMLRTTYSRDLVIEKVDENTVSSGPAPKKETAVYVVNPNGSRDSRLVADLELVHR
jgi:Domain of unknown function (DUF4384)